jgi:hypothetical protein
MDWDCRQRPVPQGLNFVTHYESEHYDVAILHLDQQCAMIGDQGYRIYSEFNEVIKDIPKIVINHGSPVYPEASKTDAEIRERIRQIVGDNTMVVNSYAAGTKREWGFGVPIIHGLAPQDWRDHPKEPRVFSALPLQGLETYYNKKCLKETGEYLFNRHGYVLACADYNVFFNNSFEGYRDYLGRSLLYFDPSVRTPMNLARAGAFLSGCCVLQVEGAHDLDRWAKSGENTLLVPNDAREIATRIAYILENRYNDAVDIGQKGKEMATEQFSRERYRKDWVNLLETLIHE